MVKNYCAEVGGIAKKKKKFKRIKEYGKVLQVSDE